MLVGSSRTATTRHPGLLLVCLALLCAPVSAVARQVVLVESGTAITYLANVTDPAIAADWIAPDFDDSGWSVGVYGVGYDILGHADGLIQTAVPTGVPSVYTRATFNVTGLSEITALHVGADYDDGYVVWINGVEVYRSPELPAGPLSWDTVTQPASHESSNGAVPNYLPLHDVSASGIAALQPGENVLAVGVWNFSTGSSDLVLVPQLVADSAVGLTRGPYLQLGTPETITVRWRTADAQTSRVAYGTDPAGLGSAVEDPTPVTEHVVTLESLSPDTLYYYSVGSVTLPLAGGDADHFFVTAPPSGAAETTRIWVLGDSGTGNADQRAVRDAYYAFSGPTHTDLWLMLGDNAYLYGTDDEYQTALFDVYPQMLRRSVLWPTIGNHDALSASSASQSGPYFDIFTLPAAAEAGGIGSGTEAYYSFDYGNIHFVVLDSADSDLAIDGPMLSWLADDLASTLQDWIIAYWHHPPYSKGSHDSDVEGRMIDVRVHALPLLEDAGVDLVLTGHSHGYERSFLIDGHYGFSDPFDPDVILDAGNGHVGDNGAYFKPTWGPSSHEGAVYVVAGNAGWVTAGGSLDHPVMYLSMLELGSLVLDVDGHRLDVRLLGDSGSVLDEFTILKPGCQDNPAGDLDGDGVCDADDNCPDVSNPDQHDADHDDQGDVCDFCPDDPLDDCDCNDNGVPDEDDLAAGTSADCDGNDMPDECDIVNGTLDDCNGNGVGDVCELEAGSAADCNGNGLLDECDLAGGAGIDEDGDGVPDECQDCDANGVLDSVDINQGSAGDADGDGVPDPCERVENVDRGTFHLTIGLALATAFDGDTILVRPGIYPEALDFAGKAVTLRSSAGAQVTTIDGTGLDRSVVRWGDPLDSGVLDGFRITGGSGTVHEDDETYGGGVHATSSAWPALVNCIVEANTADHGGGIHVDGPGLLVINTIFRGNTAFLQGGAIHAGSSSAVVAQHATIHQNTAGSAGGAVSSASPSFSISNSILWDNGDSPVHDQPGSALIISSSLVEGGYGSGNIDANPLFVDPIGGDHRLLAASPCIDAGDDAHLIEDFGDFDEDGDTTEPFPVDFERNTRSVDGHAQGTAVVDLGAYEYRTDGPQALPDGTGSGEPLRGTRLDAEGTQIAVTSDAQCLPPNTMILYGALDRVATHELAGAVCSFGPPGNWSPVPAGDLWFVIVGYDANGTESSWGRSSSGERNGIAPSLQCATTTKNLWKTCP